MTENADQERFSDQVAEKLGNYIYRLIDPRNGETFYVGKGRGNRVFQHARGVKVEEPSEDDFLSPKYERIAQILTSGLKVIHVIHRHDIPNEAISEVEAAVIDAYPGLTNLQRGIGSGSKGPMDYRQIIDKYELPELEYEPREALLLINVNDLGNALDRSAIYDQVRYAWSVSVQRAERADYVLAVRRGVVVGAFVADKWLKATQENFSDIERATVDRSPRYGFVGSEAPQEIWERFAGSRGKRITNEAMKHVRYPLRYWRI